jgi:ribose transport system ATP-binding protein
MAGMNEEQLVRAQAIARRYGPTVALAGADLALPAGAITSLVGHNGAGKSTLVRVICGLTRADAGALWIDGCEVASSLSFAGARRAGIRIAFQELSLCAPLRVFENVLITHPELRGLRWRGRAADAIARQLDEIFPGHGISPRQRVSTLSLAQRQMLEIARAALPIGDPVRMLILDEPTSAMGAHVASQLFEWLRAQRDRGLGVVLITHRLREVVEHSDRLIVMRDGQVVAERPGAGLTPAGIVELMGSVQTTRAARIRAAARPGSAALRVENLRSGGLRGASLTVGRGEIVGLAGLDGQGQRELLAEIWRLRRRPSGAVRCSGRVAFVSGDRQSAGLFRLWSLAENVSVSALRRASRAGLVRPALERSLVSEWIKRLTIRSGIGDPVSGLSGGTQQKAIVARALVAEADLVVLDDPFRGVDSATKQQTYELFREEAARGRSFLWFTTENDELEECDRVYVLRHFEVVEELRGDAIREDRIIAASFAETAGGAA